MKNVASSFRHFFDSQGETQYLNHTIGGQLRLGKISQSNHTHTCACVDVTVEKENMPSRKREKGKERRAKKDDDGGLNQLISTLSLKDHHGKTQHGVCSHGCEPFSFSKEDICYRFAKQFEVEMKIIVDDAIKSKSGIIWNNTYKLVIERLAKSIKYNEIWTNKANQERLVPLLLCMGTNYLLKNEERFNVMALAVAIASLFAKHSFKERELYTSRESAEKLRDLSGGHERETVRFIMKRIPCKCLNKRFSRVKSQLKVGVCQHCWKEMERKHLLLCGRCRIYHYCSVECQRAGYDVHKVWCRNLSTH